MLEDLIEFHYPHEAQQNEDSFMQLPCFLAPSPLHSTCLPEENETELCLQEK
jgi:hypothetical protein